MTFGDYEASRTQGRPITLYKFFVQDNVYAYTDNEQIIPFSGDDYLPIVIDRTSITASGTTDKAALTISMPKNLALPDLFLIFPPSDVVSLTIFQGHPAYEVDFQAVWTGRVLSCSRDNKSVANLTCEPIRSSMRRPGLRRRWQYGCPHAVYGDQCRASRAANTVTATLGSISNNVVLAFPAGWNGAFDAATFLDGMVNFVDAAGMTHSRTILDADVPNNRLTITHAIAGLANGATMSITRGCDHLETGCTALNNINNYGGDPWIPLKNPVSNVNNYY